MKKLIFLFALAGTLAFSQTQVAPITNSHVQLFDASGKPCAGCLLDTFTAGTTSALATFSESTGTSLNSNPVVADANGYVTVYFQLTSYKLRLRSAAGVTIYTQDGISPVSPLTAITFPVIVRAASAATSGANQSSPSLCFNAFYFNITSLTDQWCMSDVIGTGTAPTTTFTVTHSGSGGTATVNFPNVAFAGITGLTNAGDETNSATSTVKWGSSGVLTPDTGLSRVSAGVLAAGNGTQGNNTATVQAGGFWINSGAGGVWNFIAGMFDQISTGGVRWSSGANATTGIDTGVTRGGAAATVAIGNGTAGNASGTLKVAKLNNGADLAIPATGSNVVSDTATQTLSGKTLTGAANGNSVTLLNAQGPLTAVTGTAADATLYTYTLPANTLGAGKCMEISLDALHGTGAASPSYKLKFGSATLWTISGGASARHFAVPLVHICNNPGVTNAQNGMIYMAIDAASITGVTSFTSAIDTTVNQTILFTFNVAATDTVTPEIFINKLIQ